MKYKHIKIWWKCDICANGLYNPKTKVLDAKTWIFFSCNYITNILQEYIKWVYVKEIRVYWDAHAAGTFITRISHLSPLILNPQQPATSKMNQRNFSQNPFCKYDIWEKVDVRGWIHFEMKWLALTRTANHFISNMIL